MKTLRDARIGETVTVLKVHGEGAYKRRVMDMGITKGVDIYVRKVAPLGDPVEITVRGYELSLRRDDAGIIEVGAPSKAPEAPVSEPAAPALEADDAREIRIALAGDPNCGKTTLFNALTGGNQYVGNWPGVTVERKEGRVKGLRNVVLQDLPGIYSLSPYSPEEIVTRAYLVGDRPDAIVNIVDGTNVERNLYLTTQLLELGIPTVVAVNMMDVVRRNGDDIDFGRLSRELRCPVMPISALTGEGTQEVAEKAVALARTASAAPRPHVFTGSVEHAIAHIEESIQGKVPEESIRWYAIKIFERDEKAYAGLGLDPELLGHLDEHVVECEREMDDDCVSIIIDQRYARVKELADAALRRRRRGPTLSDRIDRVMTNRILALPIFFLSLCAMWWLAVAEKGPGTVLTDWANDQFLGSDGWHVPFTGVFVPGLTTVFDGALDALGVGGAVKSVVLDGAWSGVATVLGFVPVLAIVFLFLGFLEDCGYMARVAFIMDRLFRKFGLSGKSLIPMLVGKGCGVPAVMAARTIEDERDRRMTILLTTFVPCGAKTVIIAMFASLFFREMWYVAPLMDVVGVAIVVLGGIALRKTRAFAGEASPFVMELPAYHLPTLSGIWHHTWTRVKGYVWKAGAVIFPACVALWCTMHFDWTLTLLANEEIERSILHDLGTCLAWLLVPQGFGTWQGAAASVSAEIAKEQATATLGLVAANAEGGIPGLFAAMSPFPRLAALSFLLFNLFVPPCMAAIAVTFREMGSRRWGWFAVGFQLLVGYVLSMSAYRIGVLLAGGGFGVWTAVALLADAWCLWMICRPARAGAAR